jgi:hypothetical protein
VNGFYRDMAILALAIVAGVLWTLYSLITRRGHRVAKEEQEEAVAAREVKRAPVPGLPEYAAAHAWTGPATELAAGNPVTDYVHEMFANIWGYPRSVRASADVRVDGPFYANLYSGQAGNRAFTIGNLWMGFGAKDCPGSVCVLHLGEVLPPLFVNLRRYQPFVRFGMKEMAFESEAFNRRFQVMAIDRKYTLDVVSERTMELLLERDDWVFFLEFDRLVCLAKATLDSVQDYTDRLDAVTRFADLIPHFVEQDRALTMPTLPDGTTLDIADPASREKLEQAVMAMSPEERERFVAQARAQGVRFLAGMFGKDLPPGLEERLEEPREEGGRP